MATKIKVIPRKYVEAVDRGVELLDLLFGRKKWLKRMDMEEFDITDPHTCVAGNIFKDRFFTGKDGNNNGYERFIDFLTDIGADDDTGIKFGFNFPSSVGAQYLQGLWVRKIHNLKRRT